MVQLTLRPVDDTLQRISDLAIVGYRLRTPVIVSCQRDGDSYVARVFDPPGIDVFGAGVTAEAARRDLAELMCESLESLRRGRSTLGRHLLRELAALESLLETHEAAPPRAEFQVISFPTTTSFGGWGSTQALDGLAASSCVTRDTAWAT